MLIDLNNVLFNTPSEIYDFSKNMFFRVNSLEVTSQFKLRSFKFIDCDLKIKIESNKLILKNSAFIHSNVNFESE